MRTLLPCSALALILFASLPARADTWTGCDNDPGLATADGVIGAGEYSFGSTGVGSSFGDVIGDTVDLFVDSDAAGNLAFATAAPGGCAALGDAIVIYIDSIPGLGITNTSELFDHTDLGRSAVSGSDGTNAADLAFAPGFEPDYAISIEDGSASLFALTPGPSLSFVASLSRTPSSGFGASCVKELQGITMFDIGSQPGNPFRFVATLINPTNSFRSDEFQGIATATAPAGNIGANPWSLADGDWNTFRAFDSEPAFSGPFFYTDFDNFTGSGFTPAPTCGQLDSDSWEVTGFSDGDLLFGGTGISGDFARGASPGGVAGGGTYRFDAAVNDGSLGVQPTGADFTPGAFTLRVVNNAADFVGEVAVSLELLVLNDQDRSLILTTGYSTDGVAFTPIPALEFTTPVAADPVPSWVAVPGTSTLTSLSIPPGGSLYLRFGVDDAAGTGSRDEVALGELVLVPTYTTCGDGVVDVGEACDLGAMNGATPCDCQVDCTLGLAGTACSTGAGGPCDDVDTCDGAGTCTPNFLSSGVCRAATGGPCDVAESCDGSGPGCPMDGFAMTGTVCNAAGTDPCDIDDVCNGLDATCPTAVAMMGTPCRASTAPCDAAETCDGVATTCPTDMAVPDGTACGDGVACNGDETCTAGICGTGAAIDCDDGNLCTTDMCTEPAGACSNAPMAGCCNVPGDCMPGEACVGNVCMGTGTDAGTPGTDSGAPGTDAGAPGTDAGAPSTDSGMPGTDAASPGTDSGVSGTDAGSPGSDAGDGDGRGCSCRLTSAPADASPAGFVVVMLGLALLVTRRRRLVPRL